MGEAKPPRKRKPVARIRHHPIRPPSRSSPERHHRLKGSLDTAAWKGEVLERWQYEVTGGRRIWYLIDDTRRTAWITYAGTGHPRPRSERVVIVRGNQ
jgi:hypothetical protein